MPEPMSSKNYQNIVVKLKDSAKRVAERSMSNAAYVEMLSLPTLEYLWMERGSVRDFRQ